MTQEYDLSSLLFGKRVSPTKNNTPVVATGIHRLFRYLGLNINVLTLYINYDIIHIINDKNMKYIKMLNNWWNECCMSGLADEIKHCKENAQGYHELYTGRFN